MAESISIGIVGAGFGQHVHLPAFRTDNRCQVVGVCARTSERAREVATCQAIPKAFGDWREMVADPGIAVLSVAVPPAQQADIVQAGAAAGKHVFCEKPSAATAEQAREMLRAVEQTGVVHAIDFLFPEIEAWKKARQVLLGGELGQLRQVCLSWRVETYAHRARLDSWKLRREEGGGTLNNFVSHSLYYLEWLFGPLERLAARLTPRGGEGDARVDVWFELARGVPGTLSVAADAFLGSGHRLDVYGEQGTMVLENRSADYVSGFTLAVGTRSSGKLIPVEAAGRETAAGDGRIMAMAAIVHRFLDAITLGSPMSPNLKDGLRVQELIEVIRAADLAGSWQVV
jgi:predicted dehydrogenase